MSDSPITLVLNSGTVIGGHSTNVEDYSSAVAAAVANIIKSAKEKEFKEAQDMDRVDELVTESQSTENLSPTTTTTTTKKSGKSKKSKSKVVRTKSKTKTTGVRKSATVKGTSRQPSLGSLATALHNAVSHSGGPIPVKVPAPNILPRSPNVMDLNIYLNRIQQYFNQLGYHRQGEPKIRVNTNMSIKHQVETARALIKAGEPIKCLHALVMAIHFTNCSNHIERFPINFKSEFKGKEYKHVVLGVYLYGLFGALGISRDPGLQDKPAAYTRLVDLIADFHKCYTESGHFVLEVKIGGIITHDPHSLEVINWKVGSISMTAHPTHIELAFEKIAKQLRAKMGSTCLRNIRPTQLLMFSPDIPPSQPTVAKESTTPLATTASSRPHHHPLPASVKKSKTISVTLVGSASSTNNKVKKKVDK